jgi:hypothetical protein
MWFDRWIEHDYYVMAQTCWKEGSEEEMGQQSE